MVDRALDSREQQDFIERLAELANSGMPLPEGLRAAAQEAGTSRIAGQLRTLASRLESGASWEDALQRDGNIVAPHILGVIRAGIRSGNLGDALNSLLDQERAYRDIWRQLGSTLAYPIIVLAFTVVLLFMALILIVRPMKDVFADFGTELPRMTETWIQIADDLPSIMVIGTVAVTVGLGAIRLLSGRSGWMRFVSSIPIIGPMVHFAGVAQMLRLLQIMLSHEIPLPEAMRLTSSGVANANVRRVLQWLAAEVESGASLSDLMESTERLPMSIVPVVRWGEKSNSLSEAMRCAYELLEGRIQLRSSLLTVLIGPLMLIVVGAAIGSLVVAMFLPLFTLLQYLT